MSTLYTITCNLLAEWTVEIAAPIRVGKTQRAVKQHFQVGGKGINVTRMANRLDRRSVAIIFPAGNIGQMCVQWLESSGVQVLSIPQQGESRTGYVVRCENTPETTFLGLDQPLAVDCWQEALNRLKQLLVPGDGLCICGSIPGWSRAHAQLWLSFVNQIKSKIWIGIDTYGPALRDLSGMPCDCIKINHNEWLSLFPDLPLRGVSAPQALRAAPGDIDWIVTDGPERIWGRSADKATVFRLTPPEVQEVSATGCGDVLMAVIADGILAKMTLVAALRRAAPFASANAASPGVADMDINALPELSAKALEYYDSNHPTLKISTLIYLHDADGKLLLMQRRKAPNDGLWSPIGGKLEMGIGESPYEAACRETAEETGVLIQSSDLHMFAMIAEKNYEAKCHWLMFLFACKIPLKNCPPDIDEGHFAFHAPEEVMNLPIPQTDREALWKIYFEHRDGFVALRADCAPGKPLVFHVDERM